MKGQEYGECSARCVAWASRLVYMNACAYYAEELEDIASYLKHTGDAKDGEFVMTCCETRKKIAELYIRVPVDTQGHIDAMNVMARFRKMYHVALNA